MDAASGFNSGDEDRARALCAMASLSGSVREFDPSQESFGAYSRWLEQYLVANSVSAPVKRRATLLSVIGPRTFALLEDLVAPQAVGDMKYEELISVLQGHFEPKSSEIVARFRFNSCCREDRESVTEYAARLRKLAKSCKFASETLPEMLQDRLVCGIRDARLQARLLSQQSLKAAVHWVRVNALSAESSPNLTLAAMGLRADSARWLSVRAEPLTR